MSSHLVRRGGIWWARLVVPVRLRDAVGRREFIQSCRTHEVAIAKLVAAVLLADWRRDLLRLESVPMTIDVLKLVEGSPVLSVGGWVPLAEAVGLSGIGMDQLLRAAANGVLKLSCRLSWVSTSALGAYSPSFAAFLWRAIVTCHDANTVQDKIPRPLSMLEFDDGQHVIVGHCQ